MSKGLLLIRGYKESSKKSLLIDMD